MEFGVMKRRNLRGIARALAVIVLPGIGAAQEVDRTVLPIAPPPFAGTIDLTAARSTPDWPVPVKPPAGAPNIVVIMTDDIGFGTSSTFGGPVPTPALDALAREGLRYNNFNTTAMCSPTRAALLTGRNSHAVGSGAITDAATGFPGYNSVIPRGAATFARVLRDNGYNTAMFGKHHNIPRWEASLAGPFDHWPTGLGFEYFFGFIIGDTDQWNPRLYRNTLAVDDAPGKGETLDSLLADDAINWVHQQKANAPDKPFLIYYATGTGHGPHQAPAKWIARFRGRFDAGWDSLREETFARQKQLGIIPADAVLTPRPDAIPPWSTLSPTQRRLFARYMEVFAGMLAYQDLQIGRLIAELRRMGQLDNTLLFFIEGDNGASGEGGLSGTFNEIGHHKNGLAPRRSPEADLAHIDEMGGPGTQPLYPAGWAWALNTPFRWTKQVASHLGGIRNGLVVRWPGRLSSTGTVRRQFIHVSDIAPTILEAAGLPAPRSVDGVSQQPITGQSLARSFSDPAFSMPRTQYFEMWGNRAVFKDGWFANTALKRVPWRIEATPGDAWSSYAWELYDLDKDFSQARDIAAENPDRLRAMQQAFLDEARSNQVLPINDELSPDRLLAAKRHFDEHRRTFEWWGGNVSIAEDVAPSFAGTSFTVTVDLAAMEPGATGVLLARGSWFGGWRFHLDKGRPVVTVAASERTEDTFVVAAGGRIAQGASQLVFRFTSRRDGKFAGGDMCIGIVGQPDACGVIARTPDVDAGQGETLDIGKDTGVPVTNSISGKEPFSGRIDRVRIDLP